MTSEFHQWVKYTAEQQTRWTGVLEKKTFSLQIY